MIGVAGLSTRLNLRYLPQTGSLVNADPGPTYCASTNDRDLWTVDLDDYESNKIGQVEVELQTLNGLGVWTVVGDETVSVAA
jgi:hypothetical protein